ncbi:MAG: ribosomal protein S18-alanine N-acetyltransferase [Acidobacteria bacterium]|nr:ribosomal protein S18-alanine N-acetyltransferase [Acidobacteriota bacterium]
MAVFQTIKQMLLPVRPVRAEAVIPAPETRYAIQPLTSKSVRELVRLNARCFLNGENYTKATFAYLLNDPETISYQMLTEAGEMVGFIFAIRNTNGTAHLTTIGIAPEHRRRGLASRLLEHLEGRLAEKGLSIVALEVRVSNTTAQALYQMAGYACVQRLDSYYHNGEDGFLMTKSLF